MTVSETITAFDKILSEMYTHVRTRVTLVKKYHNIPMRKGLEAVAQQYCKQHELGQCSQEDKFRWRAPINDDQGYEDDSDDSDDSSNLSIWRDRPSRESKLRAREAQTPEYHLCQT